MSSDSRSATGSRTKPIQARPYSYLRCVTSATWRPWSVTVTRLSGAFSQTAMPRCAQGNASPQSRPRDMRATWSGRAGWDEPQAAHSHTTRRAVPTRRMSPIRSARFEKSCAQGCATLTRMSDPPHHRPLDAAGVFPLALGGDHSVTLAELRVLARRHGPLALVQLDAHGDTWDEYFGQRFFHGTTFRRAHEEGLIEPKASVQAGLRGSIYGAEDLESARELGFVILSCDQLRNHGPGSFASLVRERIGRRPVFLSFDIDVLDPAFAPGTGTPEVGGLSTAEALSFLRALRGIALAGADVAEVSPPYDGPGQPTALAAANVAYELLSLRALAQG